MPKHYPLPVRPHPRDFVYCSGKGLIILEQFLTYEGVAIGSKASYLKVLKASQPIQLQ